MSHQTIQSFTPGTLVWIKIYNRIWWPGKIVDPITAPQELQEFMNRKKNPIAMVYFERDKKYDIVINMDKISLYSCPKKMEFVKKGYSLYLKEQKGTKIQNVEMKNFLKDVVEFEKEIGGDINIFKEFENEDKEHAPPPKELIKELFVSSKSAKKSLTNFKTQLQLTKSLKSAGPSKFQENPVSKTRASSIQSSRSSDGNFVCHLKNGCNFTTNRYETLKRHMALCKTIVEDVTNSELKSKSQKRMNRTKRNSTKKTRINYDVFKNWDDDEDQSTDNSLNHNPEPGCSTESNKEYNEETILTNVNDNITHIATDATENVDEHLNGTESELKCMSQKRMSRTKRNSTKKTRINYDVFKNWDDDEDQSTDNSLNHNPEPGCSTESNKEDNEETILTKFYDHIMDIATDATENVDEYLDGTKSELNHKSQKRKSRRKRISTKKTKINYDVFKNWDDDEDQSTDNSLNHNPEPGCSTESNKEDNEETILTKFNDNIMDIATDATENVDEHLEDFEIIEKGLDNICIDSNKIIEPIPSCSGTNMQRKYSYRERSDSETNDIRNVNMTNNTEENIFDDSSDENLKSLPSITLNQCFHPFNEECIQDDENREPSPSTKTIYSEIEQLHNACHESELILNNNNCRFRRPNDEEESREAFLYKLMNDSKPVEHFYLDDNIYPTEKEICDNEKRLNQLLTSNLLPENKSEIVFGENLNEEIKEIMKSKKLSDIRLTLRGYKFDHGLPMYVYSEFKSDDLPSDIEQECEQIPKDPQVFSEEQMPELNNVNVPAAGVLQPIECANVPNETNTEPMNDDKEDEGTD